MINRNNITCGCKICISDMLLQSDLNKWRLLKMAKLDKFYINYESTKVFQIFKFDFIKYKNQIFPNNSHINLEPVMLCHHIIVNLKLQHLRFPNGTIY